jgi:DNA-binding CsgD family transcriptional regulator
MDSLQEQSAGDCIAPGAIPGHDREWLQITHLLTRAASSRGGVLMVDGATAVSKTTLLRNTVCAALSRSFLVATNVEVPQRNPVAFPGALQHCHDMEELRDWLGSLDWSIAGPLRPVLIALDDLHSMNITELRLLRHLIWRTPRSTPWILSKPANEAGQELRGMFTGLRNGAARDVVSQRDDRWDRLTDPERVVACLVSQGLTDAQVSRRVGRSVHTVNYHLRGIFRKLNIQSRVQLASYSHSHCTCPVHLGTVDS